MKMIQKMTMFVALATVLMFSSGVMAQQSPSTTGAPPQGASSMPAPAASPAKMEKFSGVLVSVDQTGQSFVVHKGKKDMTFYWDDHTKIMQGKKTLSPMDLKKGEHLTVTYKEEGGKATAERINVSVKIAHKKGESKTY